MGLLLAGSGVGSGLLFFDDVFLGRSDLLLCLVLVPKQSDQLPLRLGLLPVCIVNRCSSTLRSEICLLAAAAAAASCAAVC